MGKNEALIVGALWPTLLIVAGWLAYDILQDPAGYQIEPHPEYCEADTTPREWEFVVHNDSTLTGLLLDAVIKPIGTADELTKVGNKNNFIVRRIDRKGRSIVAFERTPAAPEIAAIVPPNIPLCATVYQSNPDQGIITFRDTFGFTLVPQNKWEAMVHKTGRIFSAANRMVQGHQKNAAAP